MNNPALLYRFQGIYKFISNSNERKFFWMSIKYGSRKRYLPCRIKFLNLNFEVPDALSFIWQFKEIFVEEYYKFKTSSSIPLIYDCGSNVGTSCAYFKYLYPNSRIVAFEPNPKVTAYLEKNIINNSLQNIKVIKKAVWTNEDEIVLGFEDADGSSIHLDKNKAKVTAVRLKNLLEKEDTIDMLKMDIEGAEFEVLNDCRNSLKNIKNIFVEFHSFRDKPQKLSELTSILEENGFRYFILQQENRSTPFLNHISKSNPNMELQLNIFAYRKN